MIMRGSSGSGPAVLIDTFDTVLTRREIHCVYQPIIAFAGGETVAYEALARGPADSPWRSPDAMIHCATAEGRLAEFDWVCRAAASRGALAGHLPRAVPLFVNIEPAACRVPCPPDLGEVIWAALAQLQIVAEITERAITDDPEGLLAAVDQLRLRTSRIALDDVGADPHSQAAMRVLEPDVIKIDREIVQHPDTAWAHTVIDAVVDYATRTG